MSRKSITLKDVAQAVGVSVNTVSCVLNPRNPGNGRVSEATRAAILKSARQLGYRRNMAAAHLAGSKTFTLGVLISSLTNPMAGLVVDAFEEQAIELGYQCFLGCTRYRGLRKLDYIERFLSLSVDGLLLTTIWNDPEVENALNAALDSDMPVVFIDRMWEQRPAPLICGNHYQGGQLLGRHLLDVGHRKMAFLATDMQRSFYSIRERIRGVRETIDNSGERSAHLDELWSPGHNSTDFARIVHARLQQQDPPTVIVCSGDLTAMELICGLAMHGIHVPRDLCVTGYDDVITPYIEANLNLNDAPRLWNFKVTTVRQPMAQIGRKAAQVLIDQIATGPAKEFQEHLLPVELIVSESSLRPLK